MHYSYLMRLNLFVFNYGYFIDLFYTFITQIIPNHFIVWRQYCYSLKRNASNGTKNQQYMQEINNIKHNTIKQNKINIQQDIQMHLYIRLSFFFRSGVLLFLSFCPLSSKNVKQLQSIRWIKNKLIYKMELKRCQNFESILMACVLWFLLIALGFGIWLSLKWKRIAPGFIHLIH